MAITINGTPQAEFPNPVYDPIQYSVSSNNIGQSNFKYICDIYPSGIVVPIRKKQPAEPDNGFCMFDVAGVMKSFVSPHPPKSNSVIFKHAINMYNNYQVKFGEEYGPSSGIVVYPNLATDNDTSFAGTFSYKDFAGQSSMANHILGASPNFGWLSNAPSTLDIGTSEQYFMYLCNGESPTLTAYNIVLKTFNSSGTLIQTVKWGSTFSHTDYFQYVGVGPKNLSLLTGTETRFSGSLPVITASVSYYTIYIERASGAQTTPEQRFNITDRCQDFNHYRLCFMNNLGGYDSFTFTAVDQKQETIQRDFFKKRQGSWVSNVWTLGISDRAKSQYNTIIQDQLKLVSGWISESESTWLEELISSPDVYIIDNTLGHIPVVINDSQYMFKTFKRDRLFNLEILIDYSYSRFRQQW